MFDAPDIAGDPGSLVASYAPLNKDCPATKVSTCPKLTPSVAAVPLATLVSFLEPILKSAVGTQNSFQCKLDTAIL